MKRYYITIIFVLIIYSSNAQDVFHCLIQNYDSIFPTRNGLCQPNENGWWEYYSNLNQYIPDMDSAQPLHVPPIKTIKVNVNIIQKDDGTGNFDDTETTRQRFRYLFEKINEFYSSCGPSDTIYWVTELPDYDSRIRFSIGEYGQERIYFYQNTTWWNYGDVGDCNSITSYIRESFPERMDAINLYVLGNPNGIYNSATALFPQLDDFHFEQSIAAHYWQPVSDWALSMLIAHEFGHSLYLLHTYLYGGASAICDQDNPEFLKDVFLTQLPDVSNCPHESNYYANAFAVNGDGITNNLMGGNENQKYISPMQAGQMHRALSLYSVRKYVQSEKSNIPLVISDNQLWDFDMKLYQDLIIENGATLTLTCHLVMHPNAKVIIKPGGRLIVDGAIIGVDLFEKRMWSGIQVWGNSSLSQYPDRQGNYLQGYLELKNGATIENAVCAVELWKPEDITTTGGIIIADSAFFINNAKAVHALAYSNISPYNGYEMGYLANFDRCTFAINSDYLGTETFHKHVDLSQVKGIQFNGCSFSSDPNVTGVSPWCSAIAAYDAGFSVNGLCDRYCNGQNIAPCPDQCLVHSTFSGFYDAIHAQHNVATIQPFTVRDAVFSGNDLGIYAINTGYPNVHDNTFHIGRNLECGYGVYVENLVNFLIEENDFYPFSHYSGDTYGIGVFGSPATNDVYLNSFNWMTCGNLSVGLNIVQTQGFSGTIQGLTYTCNQNSLNGIDFCVLKDNGYGNINPEQGSSASPAGNTFSGSVYHFYNDGNDDVDYYYQSGATSQTPNSSLTTGVTTHAVNAMKRCYSHNHGGLRMSPQEEKAELEKQYQMAQANFERFVGLYNELIESGGNEEELAELRRQVAYYANERSRAAGGIVRINLNDTVANPLELRTWLRNAGNIASDRLAVASFAQEGDFDSALELAGQLPGIYGLTGEDLVDHSDYIRLLVLFKALHDSGRTTAQLTEEEIRMVEGIAANTYGVARSYAKVLLDRRQGDRGTRHLCPTLPQECDKGRGFSGVGEYEDSDFKVTVSPNPAYTQVQVAYTLPKASTSASLSLVNVLGEKVTEVLLNENKGSTVIDLSHVPSGIYVIIVKDQNGNSCSKKLVKK